MQKAEDQVSAIEAEIGEEQARVERRLAADHQAAARHAQLIGSAYAAQKRLVADRRIRAGQFENLKATVDSNRALYNGLLQRVKETSFGLDPQATNVQIVEAVQTSPVPGHYGRVVYTVRGLLGGLVIGIALALFVERSDRSFKSPGEAVNWTGLPELGAIPRVVSVPLVDDRQSWLSRLLDRKRHAEPGEERSLDRRGAADEGLREAFRSLLASVVCQGRRGACPRVIVFTSPAPQSGTTLVAANLGSAAAEAGQRVLLIDANLRHPELHNLFGLESNLGLSDLLRERFPMPDQPIDAIVEKTLIPGLYVLPAGAATTDVPGLLNAGRMLDLLNRVRREFDFALIDTAAVLSVCDARILGRISDGVVLVARAGHTTHEHLLAAAQILLEDGTPVIGTVLDDWRPNRANPFARVRLAEAEFASGTVPA
jgi:succinoglycan biosynthesis transport protein ExoP